MFNFFNKKNTSENKTEEDIKEETNSESLEKFGEILVCGEINETNFDVYDFYEIYDRTKDYEIGEYKKVYKDDIERTYKNVIYSGYIVNKINSRQSSDDYDEIIDSKENNNDESENAKDSDNSEDSESENSKTSDSESEEDNEDDENNQNEEDKESVNNDENKKEDDKYTIVRYIVAKEIYNKNELKELEEYCECENCKNIKKMEIQPYYNKILDNFIFLLIGLIEYIMGHWHSYEYTRYLKQCLNICPVCPCCCGCIKSGHSSSTHNIKKAREFVKNNVKKE